MPEVDSQSPVPPSSTVFQNKTLDETCRLRFVVVTVTYNAERTLPRTLSSVAQQTYANITHLIVDGLSNDGTLALVQEYVEENSVCAHQHEIRFIREPDQGLYDAMNKAIENAEGNYLIFLNSGDALHSPDTLAVVADQLQAASMGTDRDEEILPAVLFGETDLVDEQGNFLRHRRLQAPVQLHWRSFLSGMLVCHQSFYVRADLAKEHPYNLSYRFSADFDWCIRIMKDAESRGETFHNTGLILTDYLSEGLTTRHRHHSLLERFRIMCRHYGIVRTIAQHLWFLVRLAIMR